MHLKECALSTYPTTFITDFMTFAKRVGFRDKYEDKPGTAVKMQTL